MISIHNLSLYFGGQDIFNKVSCMINRKDRIGLIGKNGAGKSTLLNLLSKKITPNEGTIDIPNSLIIGYLTQDIDFKDTQSLLEEVKTAFTYVRNIEKNLNEITEEMNQREDYESQEYQNLISKFSILEEKFRNHSGHNIDAEITKVIYGLGFSNSDLNKLTSEFSGGWRMRIELAKILLQKPDLLLLDEPTNHLDIESILWLENWLKDYTGAIVLVSHDKYFLDSITNRTIEISFSKINDFKVGYSKYISLRKERQEKQIQAKKNQEKYLTETKKLINKFRAKKNKAAFAQTLIKKIEKIDIIQVEKEDVGQIKFKFPAAPHSGKVSLTIKNGSKSYNDLEVLEDINIEVLRGEKIAFIGKNGEGKSTLAKMIVNKIEYTGNVEVGHKINIGYYAQNQSEFLNKNKTILEEIEDAKTYENNINTRNILGSFLFSNDDINKKIKVLSGGECARVSLCKLLLEPYNLLIMDEPTNHLDIKSKELLKNALLDYNGTLILVSHDREFLQGLTNKIYEFKNKNIKEYVGDIDSFLLDKKINDLKELNSIQKTNLKSNLKKKKRKKSNESILKKEIENLEKKIMSIEDLIKKDEKELSNLNIKNQEIILKEYQKNKEKLILLEEEWNIKLKELYN